jgi:hypothetical protein
VVIAAFRETWFKIALGRSLFSTLADSAKASAASPLPGYENGLDVPRQT